MTEATGRAAVEVVFQTAIKHGFKAVKLKYAGGEATLNFGLVRTLHHYAQSLAQQTGVELYASLLSNGVALNNSMLDFIHDNGVGLMISLDGLGASHDAQRHFINGRGSAKLVIDSINRATKRGVPPYLSITVTGQSAAGVAETVAFALERELIFGLNFYRNHQLDQTNSELRGEDEQLIAAVRGAFAVIEQNLPSYSLLDIIDRTNFGGTHHYPCGIERGYMAIDHQGDISRCQMEMTQPVTDIYATDPLSALQNGGNGFQNLPVDEKEGCRDCQWRYYCAGGCPLLTYRVTGRSDVKSPYCNVYQAVFPELLRLEELRLSKWEKEVKP
jgi:uncharacterized protein